MVIDINFFFILRNEGWGQRVEPKPSYQLIEVMQCKANVEGAHTNSARLLNHKKKKIILHIYLFNFLFWSGGPCTNYIYI